MNKIYAKVTAIIITLSLIMPQMAGAVSFSVSTPYPITEQRIIEVGEHKMASLQNNGTDSEVSNAKEVKDFAGSSYTLLEFKPTGYMLYHEASGKFIEYAPESPSPYLGFKADLLYGGPMEYYIERGDNYVHTLTNEAFSLEDAAALNERCTKLNEMLANSIDFDTLSYINSGNTLGFNNSAVSETAVTAVNTYAMGSYGYIYPLTTQTQMDYVSGGYCGYIAASLLLYYMYRVYNTAYVSSNYIGSSGGVLHPSGLTNYLISLGAQLGYGSDSTAYSISAVLTHYGDIRGMSINVYMPVVFTFSTIKARIDSNYPVILFGSLNYPDMSQRANHAVLVYGYSSANDVICHYGWSGYSHVYVTGIWGSMCSITA